MADAVDFRRTIRIDATRLTPEVDPWMTVEVRINDEAAFTLQINPPVGDALCLMPGFDDAAMGQVARALQSALSMFLPR